MAFVTDKQTWNDLEIFGSPGSETVYDFYNCCLTKGGQNLLDEMLHYPLSDAASINQRSQTIALFAASGMSFPFTVKYFSPIETYLADNDERSRLTGAVNTFRNRIRRFISKDIETETIYKGIEATVNLLVEAGRFLDSYAVRSGHPYLGEYMDLQELVRYSPLKDAALTDGGSLADHYVRLDTLFRFSGRNLLLSVLRSLYRLDVYFSLAKLSIEREFSFPEALPGEDSFLELKEFYHPLLKNPVKNTLRLDKGNNVVFLTGANMAGKSTLMKSLGIVVLLGHAGLPVPAASMRFSVLDGIYSTINLPDNLRSGASHFFAEVLRVKKIALELADGKRLFVIFDEMFRGTNVKDAYDATIAIGSRFAGHEGSLFLVSSHIVEAAPVLREQRSTIYCIYLPTSMNGPTPVYTYRLLPGVSDDRQGMIIISNEGILDILRNGYKTTVHEDEISN